MKSSEKKVEQYLNGKAIADITWLLALNAECSIIPFENWARLMGYSKGSAEVMDIYKDCQNDEDNLLSIVGHEGIAELRKLM